MIRPILFCAAALIAAPACAQTSLPPPSAQEASERPPEGPLPLAVGPAAASPLDQAAVAYVLPNDIKWVVGEAESRAKVFGDAAKPGPYAYLIRWRPGRNSQPHFHSTDRFMYVISGDWWTSTSKTYDPKSMHPIPAGSFVKHAAGAVHWDGAREGPTVVLIMGMGPVVTTQVKQP